MFLSDWDNSPSLAFTQCPATVSYTLSPHTHTHVGTKETHFKINGNSFLKGHCQMPVVFKCELSKYKWIKMQASPLTVTFFFKKTTFFPPMVLPGTKNTNGYHNTVGGSGSPAPKLLIKTTETRDNSRYSTHWGDKRWASLICSSGLNELNWQRVTSFLR